MKGHDFGRNIRAILQKITRFAIKRVIKGVVKYRYYRHFIMATLINQIKGGVILKALRLMKLSLRNFKGIREFTLEANGNDVSVYGDNATGKTTIFDAFTWLLFGKDSNNRTDFEIKTLDKDNNVLHGLEHEVEGVFRINEKEITLRKVYAEKWTKKRGSASQEFTGHTTSYYIDGVPVKKKDYTSQVAEIIDEDVFKLLTNPSYFNEQLNKDRRRAVLMEVCGDITDSDVIASNKDLAELPDILSGRSIDDHRKVIASERRKINQELDRIPVRIDEVQRSIPELPEMSERYFENSISEMKEIIERKEAEITRIQSGGGVAEKETRLREIESELMRMENEHQKETYNKINEKQQEVLKIQLGIESLQYEVNKRNRQIEEYSDLIEKKKNEMSTLRQEWHEVDKQKFDFDEDTHCPTCGQELPREQIEEAREKALEHFNREKAKTLESINEKGKRLKDEVTELEADIQKLQKEIAGFENKIKEKQEQLKTTQNEIEQLEANQTSIESDPDYIQKKKEYEAVQQDIQGLRLSTESEVLKIRKEIDEFKEAIECEEREKAKFSQARQAEQRIEELKQQERELASEYERLEHELYLTEEFTRTKARLLEEKINSMFRYAKFKLFEQQINGGLQETCETLYEGVPYGRGLNNAARINVGLDIINTLSEHYGFSAPIFIDNREAVTQLIDVNAQVISLIVSENDKTLRIETEEKSIREAF